MTYRPLTTKEMAELREEMKAAGEWARTVLGQERRQPVPNCESCPSSNPPMFFRTYEIFRFCSGFWPSARLTRSRGSLARRLPLTLDCAIQKAAA